MEKKDWKQRLGSYDSWAMNESMFITIDGETIYTLDKLLDFIQQELDKAREEGRDEIINRIDKTKIPKRFWNKEVYLGLIKWWEKEKIKLSKLKGEK